MKTNFLILSLFIVLLFGCSKDDDNNTEPEQQPVELQLLNTLNNDDFILTYNPDKTVKKVALYNNIYNLLYTYDQGRIKTIESFYEGNNVLYTFSYAANGLIETFTIDGSEIDVDYDDVENKYSYTDGEDIKRKFTLNDAGEIKKYEQDDSGNIESIVLLYDDAHKGPMYNSNNIAFQTTFVIPNVLDLITAGITKRPLLTLSSTNTFISFENTYDEQDFVTKAVPSNPNFKTSNYSYSQL